MSFVACCLAASGCSTSDEGADGGISGTAGLDGIGSSAGTDATATASGDAGSSADGSADGSTTGATDSATAGTDSTTAGADDAGDSDGTTGGGIRLDVPVGDSETTDGADDGGTAMGCEKIDFLFVIDNSGSMADEQQNLINSFPGFIDQILMAVEGQDHHVMVVDSDESGAWVCEEFQNGNHCNGSLVQPNCMGYTCGAIDMLDPCARTLGAGVDHPVGGRASNQDCGFPTSRRYLTTQDSNLDSAFACAAQVGTSGNSEERPMSAMVQAVSPALLGSGQCNEGFLRDDAILVVTIVSDDPPSSASDGSDASSGVVQDWIDALVTAKNGDMSAIAVIGLFATGDTSCVFGNNSSPRFEQFTQAFGASGILASVCSADYSVPFGQAVAVVDTTCDEFIPPAG